MKYLLLILSLLLPFSSLEASPDGYLIITKINLFKSVELIPDSDLAVATSFYDLSELNYGVGHLQYTSWGTTAGGRTVLVGHTPGAFERINELEVGDEIIIAMYDSYYTFYIFAIYSTTKEDGSVIYSPADNYELVLITCIDDDRRLIIKAK